MEFRQLGENGPQVSALGLGAWPLGGGMGYVEERTAINTPIQGAAADIIKKAMIEIQKRLDEEGLGSNMILQVHDELLFEVPDEEREAMSAMVAAEMESAEDLEVQLKVDMGWGRNWADAH